MELPKERMGVGEIVNDTLKGYVGQYNTEKTRQSIENTTRKILDKYGLDSTIPVSASPAWELMTIGDKLRWFLVNKLFKQIGKTIRKFHSEALSFKYQLENNGYLTPAAAILPHWAVEDPKQVIVVDALITPSQPLNTIYGDLTVDTEVG